MQLLHLAVIFSVPNAPQTKHLIKFLSQQSGWLVCPCCRVRLRAKFQKQRKQLHLAMASSKECDYSTDDSCRLQSYLFIMLKVLDKFTQSAQSVAAHQRQSA